MPYRLVTEDKEVEGPRVALRDAGKTSWPVKHGWMDCQCSGQVALVLIWKIMCLNVNEKVNLSYIKNSSQSCS